MKILIITAIAVAVMLTVVGPTFATNPWSVTSQQTASDTWVFTLWNNTADSTAVGLDLHWSDTTPDFSLDSPANWSVDWLTSFDHPAWNPDDDSFGVTAGHHLTGFQVSAETRPDWFSVIANDGTGSPIDPDPWGYVQTQAPTTPEPGSLAALMSGLAAMGGAFIKKRRA